MNPARSATTECRNRKSPGTPQQEASTEVTPGRHNSTTSQEAQFAFRYAKALALASISPPLKAAHRTAVGQSEVRRTQRTPPAEAKMPVKPQTPPNKTNQAAYPLPITPTQEATIEVEGAELNPHKNDVF